MIEETEQTTMNVLSSCSLNETKQEKQKNKKNDPNSLSKKIRKRKSKNNDHLLVRKKEYSFNPIILWQPQQYQFHLINDIVIDFDLIRCTSDDSNLNRGLLWTTFKSTCSVNLIKNGSTMEWIQENINQPMLNTSPLINMLQSLNTQSAYQLANDLGKVNEYTVLFANYIRQMNPQQRVNIFAQRRAHSIARVNQIVESMSENNISLFYEFLYNDKQQSHEYRRMGYSRKLLSIIGIDINDAPGLLLRRGFIDICTKKQQALWILKRSVLPVFSKDMPEMIEIKMEAEYQTLEGIPFNCKLHIRVYNTAYQFDKQHNLDLPMKPDSFTYVDVEIPQESLFKVYQIRSQLNILTKYSLDDFVNGEFQYLVQVENFLDKYYSSPYSYKKRKNSDNMKKYSMDSDSSHHKNSTETNLMFDNDSIHSSDNQDNLQNITSCTFTDYRSLNHGKNKQDKHQIHPSIKNIYKQQEQLYDEAFCPGGENIYKNGIRFDSYDLFLKEYEYDPQQLLTKDVLIFSNY